MHAPRQYGTLGGFIAAVSELDPGLAIYAREPWTATSRAVATSALRPTSDANASLHEHYASIFGDDEPAPLTSHDDDDAPARAGEPSSAPSPLRFFSGVADLKQAVRQLRRVGVKDHGRLCAQLIIIASDR